MVIFGVVLMAIPTQLEAYTSKDESMTLNIFTYGPASEEPPSASVSDAAVHLQELSAASLGAALRSF